MSARALVTGGRGFIGSALVRYLRECGWTVTILDQKGHDSPLGDPVALRAALDGAQVVYHLAGVLGTSELIRASQLAVDTNVRGAVAVLDACVAAEPRPRVFLCTKPNEWLNAYSITKRAAEEFGQMYARYLGLDVRILRWLNVYGPGQKAYPVRKAVPLMILQAIHDLPIEVFGSGEQPVDLIHVVDLARVTVEYTNLPTADATPRDTGLTHRMSVKDLAGLIRRLSGSASQIVHVPMREGEDEHQPIDLLPEPTAVALTELGGTAEPLEGGLQETIAYYRRLPRARVAEALSLSDRSSSRPEELAAVRA